jgi:hypothetical protein
MGILKYGNIGKGVDFGQPKPILTVWGELNTLPSYHQPKAPVGTLTTFCNLLVNSPLQGRNGGGTMVARLSHETFKKEDS